MNKKTTSTKHFPSLVATLALIFIILSPCIVRAANYPLKILNIKPSGSGSPAIPSTNRIFRAYPGIEYNIRAAVIGGLYPYIYSLSNAPNGMTINSRTGEIKWPAPQSNSGAVTLSVTDAEGTTATSTWSIAVTTTGFLFVNSSYSGTSTGSITQPFKSLLEMLQRTTSTNQNDIVYFRGGNYNFALYGPDAGYMFIGPYGSDSRPFTWIGYPNETANINGNGVPARMSNIWWDNLILTNFTDWAARIDLGGSDYKTVRRCRFSNIRASSSTNRNQGFLFISAESPGSYLIVQDNEITNFQGAEGIGSLYSTTYALIENNYTYNGGQQNLNQFATPIGIKARNTYYTIRGNKVIVPATATDFEVYNELASTNNGEILYNYIAKQPGGGNTAISFYYPTNVYLYRNTIVGNVRFRTAYSTGPYFFTSNVLEGAILEGTNVTQTANLTSSYNSGSVDTNGLLTNSYRGNTGSKGWQFGDGSTPMSVVSTPFPPPSAQQAGPPIGLQISTTPPN